MWIMTSDAGNFSFIIQRKQDPEVSLGPVHSVHDFFRWLDKMVFIERVTSCFVVVATQAEYFKVADKMDGIFTVLT